MKRSIKKEKKDKICVDAFLDLYQFIRLQELNNDLQIIYNYLKNKKYKFMTFYLKNNEIKVHVLGGHYSFDFRINAKKRKLIGGFSDNDNWICNDRTFMDYPYIRDVIMKDIPFKMSIIDQDFWQFAGNY